jgi:hypothetical protein
MGPYTGTCKMTKKKIKPKNAVSWRKLKKAMKSAGKKGTKVDLSDVSLVSPAPTADLI